jgi:hypothetical protein
VAACGDDEAVSGEGGEVGGDVGVVTRWEMGRERWLIEGRMAAEGVDDAATSIAGGGFEAKARTGGLLRLRAAGGMPGAVAPDGARIACGVARGADEGAKVHEGEVVIASVASREKGLGGSVKGGRRDSAVRCEAQTGAGKDAGDVGVGEGDAPFKGEGGDSGRGVGADAGESAEGAFVAGEYAVVTVADGPCGPMKVEGAAVVAEPGPLADNVGGGGGGESFDGGPAFEPAVVVGEDAVDLGLLEHDFGHEDGVGVADQSPGEVVAAVEAVPAA